MHHKLSKITSYSKILEKRLFFRYLMEANKPGCFALIDEKHKKVLVIANRDPIKKLGEIAAQLSNKTYPNKEVKKLKKYLKIKLLESCETKHLEVYKLKWISIFQTSGYNILNIERLPQYKVRRYITNEFTMQVQLVSKGKRVFPVKDFKSDLEAKRFIEEHTVFDMLKLIKT